MTQLYRELESVEEGKPTIFSCIGMRNLRLTPITLDEVIAAIPTEIVGDVLENVIDNPKSWVAWKRKAKAAEAACAAKDEGISELLQAVRECPKCQETMGDAEGQLGKYDRLLEDDCGKAITEELERLRADKERMDWLEARDRACLELRYQPKIGMMPENQVVIHKNGKGNIAVTSNFRDAIDAARSRIPPKPENPCPCTFPHMPHDYCDGKPHLSDPLTPPKP